MKKYLKRSILLFLSIFSVTSGFCADKFPNIGGLYLGMDINEACQVINNHFKQNSILLGSGLEGEQKPFELTKSLIGCGVTKDEASRGQQLVKVISEDNKERRVTAIMFKKEAIKHFNLPTPENSKTFFQEKYGVPVNAWEEWGMPGNPGVLNYKGTEYSINYGIEKNYITFSK